MPTITWCPHLKDFPGSRSMPYYKDCLACRDYNYTEGICQHPDAPGSKKEPVYYGKFVNLKQENDQLRAHILHLEKKLNEHIDKSKKKSKQSGIVPL